MANKTVLSDEQLAEIAIKNCILLNNVSRQTAEEIWNSNDTKKNLTSVFREVEQALLQSPEIQQLRKDAERLDFMIKNLAWAQSFERDGSILQYRLMTQNKDEDYVFMSGEDRYFNTPRDAIDAAMEAKP